MIIWWILVVCLLIIPCTKWSAYFLISIFFKYFRQIKRNRTKAHNNDCSKSISAPSQQSRKSIFRKTIRFIIKYMYGYLRYMDFQVGLIPSHHIRNFIYKYVCGVNMAEKSIIYWEQKLDLIQNLK